MKSKNRLIFINIISLSLLTISIVFATSKLSPNSTPSSSYHSLNDIYNLIVNDTTKSTPDSSISPSITPTSTTTHSTSEIYTLLANIKVDKVSSAPAISLVPSVPHTTATGYTLNDIYDLVSNSTYAVEGSHDRTKSSAPSDSMYTTTEIYNYLNDTYKPNLQDNKIRSGSTYFGIPGTFVMGNVGEYCEMNDECSSGFCGDDGWYCWYDCGRTCTTGAIGSLCSSANQCAQGLYCGQGHCTDGSAGSTCDSYTQCATGHCDTANTICTDGSLGSGCGSNADCATGLYCGDTQWWYGYPQCTDGSAGQYCGGPDSCAPGNYCNYNNMTCAATDGNVGSGCAQQSDCDAGLYCNDINYTCTDGSVGSLCAGGGQCASGYCDDNHNLCTTGAIGVGCNSNGNCASNYCGWNGTEGFCTDGSISSVCNNNGACVSGYCDGSNWICTDGSLDSGCNNNNQCQSNLCSSATSLCISGEVGTSCTLAQECTSGYCDTFNGVCKTDGSIGSGCGGGTECQSGICSSLSNTCSLGETGSACSVNSDCDTGHCSSGNICEVVPLSNGIVGYWSFDNASSTTVYDSTPNAKNGTLAGNAYINANGKLGSASTYDGSGDRMSITNNAIFKVQNFSFSAWIKKSGSRYNEAVYLHQGNGWNQGWRIFVSGSNLWYSWGNGTSYIGDVFSSGNIDTRQWFHLAVVRDESGYVNIYINGVLNKRQAAPNLGYSASSLSYTAYGDSAGASGFTGSIDELGFWNRTLTAYDVEQLYNSGNGLGYSSF